MNKRILTILLMGMLLLIPDVFAQKTMVLVPNAPFSNSKLRSLGWHTKIKDTTQLATRLENFTKNCYRAGYLSFAIDSIKEDSAFYYVYVFWGNPNSTVLIADSITYSWADKYNLSQHFNQKRIPLANYAALSEQFLSKLENDGYPFAALSLQQPKDTALGLAEISLEPGPFVTYDSLFIRGSAKLRPRFLRTLLQWQPNRKYIEQHAKQVRNRLQTLPYVTIINEPGVEFVGNKAFLYLFLDKQKTNQFDGYIGIVPISGDSNRVMLTGEINLLLQNVFRIGESLSLQWQAPDRRSQYLAAHADFPYLFGTPFGLSGNFILDKKDTTYLNMNYLLALQYSFAGRHSLQLYFNYATSAITNPEWIAQQPIDSISLDYQKQMYGISLNFNRLDNAVQPRNGIKFKFNLAAGTRRISENAHLPSHFYEDVIYKTTHYQLTGEITGFVPIRKRWGWVVGIWGGWQHNNQPIYNDLFRIGGTRTLQGFDEMSLYASAYLIANTEFRFWYAPLSYINIFFNNAWYERRLSNNYYFDYPFGFGIGTTFHTKAGNLFISYALGQQKKNPLSFKTGKIHVGMDIRF